MANDHLIYMFGVFLHSLAIFVQQFLVPLDHLVNSFTSLDSSDLYSFLMSKCLWDLLATTSSHLHYILKVKHVPHHCIVVFVYFIIKMYSHVLILVWSCSTVVIFILLVSFSFLVMNFKSLMNPFLICICFYPGDCMWQNSNENFFFHLLSLKQRKDMTMLRSWQLSSQTYIRSEWLSQVNFLNAYLSVQCYEKFMAIS